MTDASLIALVGDHNPDVTAHVAIPKALEIAAQRSGHPVEWQWIHTTALTGRAAEALTSFDAVWCVPASPYASMDGALDAIRHAREGGLPFLGTCGGYQHAILEFARNVLGHVEADNAEVNPDAEMPLINALVCALVEQSGEILFIEGSRIAEIHGEARVTEKYHCSYGLAPEYAGLFDGTALRITGLDLNGEPRTFELAGHSFFIGTAYQPERSALAGEPHPLIDAFVAAAAARRSLAA